MPGKILNRCEYTKRDMAMRPIVRGFCINRFGIDPSHYISSRSDFGFEFAEILVTEKRHADSATASRGVGDWMFKRKLPSSVSRRIANSPTRRVGESLWWVGESLFKIFLIYHRFTELQTAKPALYRTNLAKHNPRDVIFYHHWFIKRFEKNCIYRQSCWLSDTASRGVVFDNEYLRNSKPKSERLER
jgi:hypothetical protein